MEYESAHVLHDKDGKITRNGASESKRADIDVKDVSKPIPGSQRNKEQINVVDQKVGEPVSQGEVDSFRKLSMEATITTDDVIRAGGFGARDDISSFLPVASDSTDFEASIRDAQEYEQPREEVRRPGLGWTEASEPV
ncbi:hypothetical protein Ddye_011781 [Dipteronia dyeriana]|uniref:Uncharacterized protein n=1 Tax=Dipteronia dyeriana TaxID=168575 RepID=A0AAE0CHM0_9ROSI|nr:hypothetical protein Ddye_011781 [Dipteronia dyeriana]